MQIERQPLDALQKRENDIRSRLSAFGRVQGATVAAIAIGGAGQPQTVSELRDAINAAGADVPASLLTDGTGARPLLTAADAEFSLNGLALLAASNRLPGLIEGLTIELKRAQPGVPVEVTVERDTDSARATVADFVKAYNDARRLLDEPTKYDPAARSAAVLNGESVLRQVQSQLRAALSGSRSAAAGEYTRLSEVGVEFQADGSLKLDDGRFHAAAAAGLDKVARLFAASSSRDERGFAVRLKAVVESFVDPDGALSGRQEGLLRASIRTLDAQQERWEARLALIEKRLRAVQPSRCTGGNQPVAQQRGGQRARRPAAQGVTRAAAAATTDPKGASAAKAAKAAGATPIFPSIADGGRPITPVGVRRTRQR